MFFTGLFFGFEYYPKHSKGYYTAKKEAKTAIKANNFWLKKIKQKAKGSYEYDNYLKANKIKSVKVDAYDKIRENEKVKRFKTVRIFLKEFGTYFGFSLYALFNLFQSCLKRKKNEIQLFHAYILGVCIFFIYWAIQPFEDLSKLSYYFISVFSTLILMFSVILFVKYRKTRIQKLEAEKAELQKQKKEIAKFAYLNISDEMNDEMIDVLDKNM